MSDVAEWRSRSIRAVSEARAAADDGRKRDQGPAGRDVDGRRPTALDVGQLGRRLGLAGTATYLAISERHVR